MAKIPVQLTYSKI